MEADRRNLEQDFDNLLRGKCFDSTEIGVALQALSAAPCNLERPLDGVWSNLRPSSNASLIRIPISFEDTNPLSATLPSFEAALTSEEASPSGLSLTISVADIDGLGGLIDSFSSYSDWRNPAQCMQDINEVMEFRFIRDLQDDNGSYSLKECIEGNVGECVPRAAAIQLLWSEQFAAYTSYYVSGHHSPSDEGGCQGEWDYEDAAPLPVGHAFAIVESHNREFYILDPAMNPGEPQKITSIRNAALKEKDRETFAGEDIRTLFEVCHIAFDTVSGGSYTVGV